jgi:hypothetical protein
LSKGERPAQDRPVEGQDANYETGSDEGGVGVKFRFSQKRPKQNPPMSPFFKEGFERYVLNFAEGER